MTFGERIKKYIDHKGISVRSFEIKSSLKNGAIYRVVKNNTSLNGESIASIGREWEDLNLNWLMKEEGEMLVEPSIFKDPGKEYNKDFRLTNELRWYQDALKRADNHIELQKYMIDTLRQIIENQKKAAKESGIEL